MNLKHLEAFLAVIDYKTMSAAAKKLFTSQPNISFMIMELEHYYSVPLFNRTSKHLYLTPEGLKLESHARKIMREIEEMNNAMLHQKRTVRIGSSVTVGHYLLNDYLALLKTSLPMIDFKVIISNTADMEELLLENRIDLAIVEGYIHSKKLTQIPLQEDESIAVIGPEYVFEKNQCTYLTWFTSHGYQRKKEVKTGTNLNMP